MFVDILIVLLAGTSLYRGREIGFLRQLGSTLGFIAGLLLGAWLHPRMAGLTSNADERALLAAATTLGCALILLTVGEYAGIHLKRLVSSEKRFDRFDSVLGGVLSVASLLVAVWLLAAVITALPLARAQAALRDSYIVRTLNRRLPPAPEVIANVGRLIDINGFPRVFLGQEPTPPDLIKLPPSSSLQPAVEQARDSVVKIEGEGCGGLVDGSGFVIGDGLVATNAHVVAGVRQPYVEDANGQHRSTVIWFNSDLDLAILRAADLAGAPLPLADAIAADGTAAAVLGYPGGGGFVANPAAILNEFVASGRDIYDTGVTRRHIYEVQADIVPGNSGGPMIGVDGKVLGVIFAESTTYEQIGYALTSPVVAKELAQAQSRNRAVGTGQCTQ